jgi:hexokinase
VLNDAAATLLGGKAACADRVFDSYIGFILGTGTNTCYIEDNRNITKIPSVSRQKGFTLINIESGGFGKVAGGEIDIRFDNNTDNPGAQKLEKMISGAYLGGLVLEVMKSAAKEGLFSKEFAGKIKGIKNLTTKDVNDFCFYPYSKDFVLPRYVNTGDTEEDKDRIILYYIIDSVFERAARLAAVNIAAVMLKTGKGKNPCLPVCVAAEGTTFYKSKLFKYKLDHYVKRYLNDEMGIYCDFVKAENAALIGTAIAGLFN